MSSRSPSLSNQSSSERGLDEESGSDIMISSTAETDKKFLESVVDSDHRTRLEQLKRHPFFNDLQVALALDCVQPKVPYSLLSESCSSNRTPLKFDPSYCTVNDSLVKEHTNLQMSLLQLQVYFPTLLTSYHQLTDQIEMQRYKALAFNCHSVDAKQLINWFYDQERHHLINKMKESMETLMKKTKTLMPDPVKMNVDFLNNLAANLVLPTSAVNTSLPPPAEPSLEAPLDLSGAQSKRTSTSHTTEKKSRFLSKKAVSILQHWYQKHRDHPYATDEEVKELATIGGIAPNQVKKWMANTRARSFNTLTYNGGKHMLNSKLAMKKRLLHKYKIEPLNSSFGSSFLDNNSVRKGPIVTTKELEETREEDIDVETVYRQSPDIDVVSDLEAQGEEDTITADSTEIKADNTEIKADSTEGDIVKASSDRSQDGNTQAASKPSLEQVIARCHLKSSELVTEPSQNKSAIESLKDVVNNVTSVSSPEAKTSADHSPDQASNCKRYLSPRAKTILSDWFKKHLYRPYPTFEEKKELASLCDIPSVKVDTWFANKRNRTHTTKKLPPKYSHLLH